MSSMKINVKLEDGTPLPKHAKPGDAGLDLTAKEDVVLWGGEFQLVGTGVSMEIPEGYVGLVFPRSGLASKRGVTLANCVGVIDSGYRGEIHAPLHNINQYHAEKIGKGERICQLVVVPFETVECVEVEELGKTERGEDGFGSTGR